MRIVSLLPAATEIVWALGLEDDLVGVSHACDFPRGAVVGRAPVGARGRRWAAPGGRRRSSTRRSSRCGRTWSSRERGRATGTHAGPTITVVVLDPASLEGIFHAIATVGAMTDAEDEAVGLVEILRERLADVEEVVDERRDDGHHAPRVVALDGLDPLSSAGLWVPEQIRRAGGWEVLGERRRAQRAGNLGGRRGRRSRDAAPGSARDAPRPR